MNAKIKVKLFISVFTGLFIGLSAKAELPIIQPIAPRTVYAGDTVAIPIKIAFSNRNNLVVTASNPIPEVNVLKYTYTTYLSLPPNSDITGIPTDAGLGHKTFLLSPLGDINFDGVFNSSDSLLLNQFGAGLRTHLNQGYTLRPFQNKIADLNNDGIYSNNDSLIMNQYLSGTRQYLPPTGDNYHKFLLQWFPGLFQRDDTFSIQITAKDKTTNETSTAIIKISVILNSVPEPPIIAINPFTRVKYDSLSNAVPIYILESNKTLLDANVSITPNQLVFERATSKDGPWTMINTSTIGIIGRALGAEPLAMPYYDFTATAGMTYYYRVKRISNQGLISNYSNIEYATPVSKINNLIPVSQKFLFVIAYWDSTIDGGKPLPSKQRDFICNTNPGPNMISGMKSWFERETLKYKKPMPYNSIGCASSQVMLPGNQNLYSSSAFELNGEKWLRVTHDNKAILNFLETKSSIANEVLSADKVYVFIVPPDSAFTSVAGPTNYTYSSKYMFGILARSPNAYGGGWETFFSPMNADHITKITIHEYLHTLGATDKYTFGKVSYESPNGCQIDPTTNLYYDQSDIMCAIAVYNYQPGDGFYAATYLEVKITDPTAIEIGWK